jgi:hypothetical protein
MVLDKLGKGIVLREVIALYNSFIYLFMPLMGYLFYTEDFLIAARFVRYMPVSQSTYFNLALPAISGFVTVLCWPLRGIYSDQDEKLYAIIQRGRAILAGNHKIGIVLLVVGVIISFFIQLLPVALQYIFTLFYFSSFTGLLYIYFADDFPLKNTIIGLFILFILVGALRNGMFTIVAYMGMTLFSFFFLKRKIAMLRKLLVFTAAIFVLTIIQTVKPEYRKNVLRNDKENKASEFLAIAQKRLDNLDNFITPEFMWPIYYRTNQGFYVALVQKYIPRVKPHDNGIKLFQVILSSFVPRVLWPDKPMAGGIENMRYYAGYRIRGYTVNVGPLGEGYGSFGVTGGIIYMILLGALIRFAYARVFRLSLKNALVIFWIPVLFYQVTYSGENDTLQIMNSLVKSAFFIYILGKVFPQLFRPVQDRHTNIALSS